MEEEKFDKDLSRKIKSLAETINKAITKHKDVHGEDSATNVLVLETLAQITAYIYVELIKLLDSENNKTRKTWFLEQIFRHSYNNMLQIICERTNTPVMFKIVKVENE